jgi:hypothetical protein
MLHCEHAGYWRLADLCDTGNKKYLTDTIFVQIHPRAALRGETFPANTTQIFQSLSDWLAGMSSQAIPLTETAEFFWETVAKHHSYVTGGHGNNEYFGEADKLRNRLGDETAETCNVYNMLKLTDHLFEWTASVEAADFYERALFNHILASQNPEDGRVTYSLSLDMGGFKSFQDP